MKKINYYLKTKDGQSFVVSLTLKADFKKNQIVSAKSLLDAKVKKDYTAKGYDIEHLELLLTAPAKIAKSKLNEIGYDIASVWGAECTSIKTYENLVEFNCIEHGERFKTYMTYDEIREEYHIS